MRQKYLDTKTNEIVTVGINLRLVTEKDLPLVAVDKFGNRYPVAAAAFLSDRFIEHA